MENGNVNSKNYHHYDDAHNRKDPYKWFTYVIVANSLTFKISSIQNSNIERNTEKINPSIVMHVVHVVCHMSYVVYHAIHYYIRSYKRI